MSKRSHKLSGQQGAALVTAVMTATAVFLLASAVLNIVMQRFQLAATQSQSRASFYAAESAVRYAFARLDNDGPSNNACDGGAERNLKEKIRLCSGNNPYIITSWRAPRNPVIDGVAVTPHERTDDLFFGSPCPTGSKRQGHETTVWIQWDGSRYQVRGFADPAEGCQ